MRILIVGSAVAWIVALVWAIALAVFRPPALAGVSTLGERVSAVSADGRDRGADVER